MYTPPKFEIVWVLAYLAVTLAVAAYFFYAHHKGNKMAVPTGFFLCFFALRLGQAIVTEFMPSSAHDLMDLAATMFLTLGIIRLIVFVFVDYFLRHKKVIPVPTITRDIGLVVIYLISVLVVLRYKADVNLASLITTSAILTAVIGLALQDTLGNLFSGIVLQMERPYNIGDWVAFSNYTGKVIGMSWKSTKIMTREKEQIYIPNNMIAKSHIVNYSQPDPQHVAAFEIGMDYRDPPDRIREVVLATLLEQPEIHPVPPPDVRMAKFNDYSITYRILFCISDFEREEAIKSRILKRLWYRFRREGITIPYPISSVKHVHHSEEKEAARRGLMVDRAVSLLQRVDIFRPLAGEDVRKMAEAAHFETFADGELIVVEGASGDSMYVIASGECEVTIRTEEEPEHKVAALKTAEFLGEMSLLTGEKRSATVKAAGRVECIRIDKQNLEAIFRANPGVVSAISDILAGRKTSLSKEREIAREASADSHKAASESFLEKIKNFFNI